jgi:hypothetical protein
MIILKIIIGVILIAFLICVIPEKKPTEIEEGYQVKSDMIGTL